jgi:hypothetical protein
MDLLRRAHEDTLALVKTIPDRAERVGAINDAIRRGCDLSVELAAIKRETVREMVAELGLADTAKLLGITKGRVDQLIYGKGGATK